MNPVGIVLVLGGLFSIAGGVLDWEWFMNNRKARVFVGLLGRGGARIFYILLGLIITVLGGLIFTGVIQPNSTG